MSRNVHTGDDVVPNAQTDYSLLRPDTAPEDRSAHPWRHCVLLGVTGYVVMVVVMLGIGMALTHPLDGSVGHWDETVNHWLSVHRTIALNDVTEVATWFVDTLPAVAVAAVITGLLALFHRWREAAMILIALVLELVVFLSVTWVVARPRPFVVRLNDSPSTSSFPSGHTAAATVLFAGLAIAVTCCTVNRMARIGTYVFAVLAIALVGFGRVYRGMHHPTDVMAGLLLGAACLFVAIVVVRAAPTRTSPAARTSVEPESPGVRTRVA